MSHKQPSAFDETGWKFIILPSVVAKKNQLLAISETKNERRFLHALTSVYLNIKNRKSTLKCKSSKPQRVRGLAQKLFEVGFY